MTLADYLSQPNDILSHMIERMNADPYNCWITKTPQLAVQQYETAQYLPLAGAPIGVKDLIMTAWVRSTCGSRMLGDFVPEYSATCYERLIAAGWVMIGKNNLDEFAMWWSGQNSAYHPTLNPHNPAYISWWSSSGSAASVAAGQCIAALGTDTGGSVRQPAAFCGIVWVKPTYGRISRYGVQAMASSLDQVGVLTQTVHDARILLGHISGYDPRDATSQDQPINRSPPQQRKLKAVCIKQCFEWIDPNIDRLTRDALTKLESQWVEITWIDMEMINLVVAIYYIIMPAEASTNLARFDGIRYGLQYATWDFASLQEYYTYVRGEWFGAEAQRRILVGTHVLSSWYYDAYYRRAVAARHQLITEFDRIFGTYDVVLSPTSPVMPRAIWSHRDDPLSDYLADLETIPANLLWCPAMSVPIWVIDWLPVWLHIMSQRRDEQVLWDIWYLIEWDFSWY